MTNITETHSKPSASQRLQKLAALGSTQSTILVAVLVILVVVFTILEPKFLSAQTASNVLTDWGSVVLIAVGMTYVIISGGIDLSVGASIALSGVVAAWFMVDVLGLSPKTTGNEAVYGLVLGTIVAILTGLAVGLVNGFLITKAKIPPFIATLATMGAGLGFAVILSAGMPIGGPANFVLISAMNPTSNPLSWALIVVIVVVIIAGLFLHKSKFGIYTYAIGSNSFAARGAGINVERHLVAVYALSGALAGLTGMYVYMRLGAGSPSSGTGRELDAIAAVVIGGASLMGGIGRIWGTVLGTLILFTVQSGLIMVGVAPDWKKVVVAVLIAVAVAAQTFNKKGR